MTTPEMSHLTVNLINQAWQTHEEEAKIALHFVDTASKASQEILLVPLWLMESHFYR